MSRCPNPSASRSSRPNASRGRRPAASATSSTRSPGRCRRSRARPTASSTSSSRATAPCRFREGASATTTVRVPDPHALAGAVDVSIVDVAANGYRLRLVDHPAAFDRDGFYGPPGGGDFADNAWRFGLLGRAALETLRADAARGERPVDLVHIHDWHACPVALFRDRWYADDPVIGRAAVVLTIHNLAYHGWTPRESLRDLGLAPGDGVIAADAVGVDLLWAGIERSDLVNTVSPGYARESLGPELGFGLDATLRAKGDRYLGILNGLDTTVWDPATDADLAATYSAGDLTGKATCRADLLGRVGFDPTDDAPVLGMIGRLDPQKGFDLLADAAPRLLDAGARLVVLGSGDPAQVAGLPLARRQHARTGSRCSSGSTVSWPAGSTPARTSSSCRRGSSRAARAR